MSASILIIDDEADIRRLIQGILQDEGYHTRLAANSDQAYAEISISTPQLVVLDIWLQNSTHDGLEILATIKKDHPHLPVLMISGHGTIETAVSAIKQGAYDFIEKPFKSDRLLLMIERALETAQLRRENQTLRKKAEGPSDLLGDSTAMAALRQTLSRVAQTNSRVLLTGAAGTGKDVAARFIHRLSQRAGGPFMSINCAILRPERLDLELFGSADGVMGEPAKTGVLDQAHGGTLFLDEVADMPLETQGKIVRALQEQKFQRVGGQSQIEVDVRIIASTNRNLESLIQEGRFRQDLFYRLNVVPVNMPTLRERPQDIPQLISYFVKSFSAQSGIPPCIFSEMAMVALQAYDWPGNVRQLRNMTEWVMIMMGSSSDSPVKPEHLPPEISAIESPLADSERSAADMISLPLREARELFEREYLLSQIKRFGGNISRTAHFVGMERSALHRKLKQLGISESSRHDEGDEAGAVAARKIA